VHADEELVPIIAVASSIESLHRMTREERELHGVMVNGSDHLTAYNLYAEAVNQYGSMGSVYGLPRHVFEDGLEEWAEQRGVLIKAIEDTALGVASVYRSLDLELPLRLPHATREIHRRFRELIARIMPFDLVIDEHTADGQEARVSRSSVAGSWGGVAGTLRYFADRMGIPRAAIEGTTIPYDLIRDNAQWGAPTVALAPRRKGQHLVTRRRLSYFGFELETVVEALESLIPAELREMARDTLTDALMAGETLHPDQGRIRRALEELGELWRRSAGSLAHIAGASLRQRIRDQLDRVNSWEEFLETKVSLNPTELVHEHVREALQQLPSMIRIRGDAVSLDYAIDDGTGVVRLRLREGMAHQMQERDIPELDRPVRFTVVRGGEEAIRAASLPELKLKLKGLGGRKREFKKQPKQRHQGRKRR
jgi:ATP-dependent helicase HrpA